MWVFSLLRAATRFALKPFKQSWNMWKAGKGKKLLGYNKDTTWFKKLTGDAITNPRTRLIYQTFLWRQTPPAMQWIQPFTRIDYKRTFQQQRFLKDIGATFGERSVLSFKGQNLIYDSKWYHVGPKASHGHQGYLTGNFYKYFAHEYGANKIIDRSIDALTFKSQRKRINRIIDTLMKNSRKTNLHRKIEEKRNGTSGLTSHTNIAALKSQKVQALTLNGDPNLDTPTEVMRSLDLISDNDSQVTSNMTTFPKSSDSWIESALFNKVTGRVAISPKKGRVFAAPMSIEVFKMMAKSTQPGKVFWKTAWIFKEANKDYVKRRNK